MRQRESLTPEEERELDALERALAGDPVDHDLRELEELVDDIRATAPQMSPGFAARLEHQVSEGFPASGEQPARRRRPRLRVLLPAGGCLAAAIVAVVVVLNAERNDSISTFASKPQAAESVVDGGAGQSAGAAAPQASEAAPNAAAAPSPGSATLDFGSAAPSAGRASTDVAPSRSERKQQRSADLVLRVRNARVQATSDNVIRTVDRFGGIVASSQISSQGRHAESSFELRIPTSRLDEALAALSKLGNVVSRNQSLVDITGSFTSVQDRLSDARAERRGLLSALGRATTQQQIGSLRARLRNVRSQIARLNGDLDALRRRADLAVVTLTVRGSERAQADDDGAGGGWTPGDAARDAVRVLEVIAGIALVSLAVIAPLALLAAIIAFGVRLERRRRRESALDPA